MPGLGCLAASGSLGARGWGARSVGFQGGRGEGGRETTPPLSHPRLPPVPWGGRSNPSPAVAGSAGRAPAPEPSAVAPPLASRLAGRSVSPAPAPCPWGAVCLSSGPSRAAIQGPVSSRLFQASRGQVTCSKDPASDQRGSVQTRSPGAPPCCCLGGKGAWCWGSWRGWPSRPVEGHCALLGASAWPGGSLPL